MKSLNKLGWVGNQLDNKFPPSYRVATYLITLILLISIPGCFADKTEIVYSSLSKKGTLLNGAMKIAQNKVKVSIDGSDKVSDFSPAAGYYMLHKDDLEFMVLNAAIVQELCKDDAMKQKIKKLKEELEAKFRDK